jgi:hypothetical protein
LHPCEEEEAIVRARVGGGVEMGNERRRGGSGEREEERDRREGIGRKQNKSLSYISVGRYSACQIYCQRFIFILQYIYGQLMIANYFTISKFFCIYE